MKRSLDKEKMEDALSLVEELLNWRQSDTYRLIVCGGSALLFFGLRRETTKDVDILAFLDNENIIKEVVELPEDLQYAIRSVAVEMNLDEHWLNAGPSSIINHNLPNYGLPDGFINRLTKKIYGSKLTVFYISRYDQIFFKLYASVDRCGPSYHLNDLKALNPTKDELMNAAIWSMQQDPSSGYAKTLKEMLEAIGYESIAKQIIQ
jgi:Nucleotidyltransferase of unknown function (DUF6036)